MKDVEAYSLEIQTLHDLKTFYSEAWRPDQLQAFIGLAGGGRIQVSHYIKLLRKLYGDGMVEKYRIKTSGSSSFATQTRYRLSPKGKTFLEELGL